MRLNPGRLIGRGLLFAVAASVAAVFFIDYCHLVYDCGCVSLWAGGAAHCNIQTPGPPDCPVCAHGGLASGALVSAVAVQAAVLFVPGKPGTLRRAGLALLAFPVVVGAVGLVAGIALGYWA